MGFGIQAENTLRLVLSITIALALTKKSCWRPHPTANVTGAR